MTTLARRLSTLSKTDEPARSQKIVQLLGSELFTTLNWIENRQSLVRHPLLATYMTALERLQSERKEDPSVIYNQGLVFLELHRWSKAAHNFKTYISSEESRGEKSDRESIEWLAAAYSKLGLALAKMGQSDEAIGSYGKSVKLDKDNPYNWHDLAKLYQETGQKKRADNAYNRVRSIDSKYYTGFVLPER